MNATRWRAGVTVAVATTLGLGACGSTITTEAGSSTSKGVIRLMVDGVQTPAPSLGNLSFPYGAAGAQAAAAALNAAGGVDGRRIQIDVCDNAGNPNTSAQCGRAAKSRGDIAVVGSFDPPGARAILPVLQSEGIPYIGGLPSTPVEFQSAVSFQFDPGATLGGAAQAQLWVASKCTRVALISPTQPGETQLAATDVAIAGRQGVPVSSSFVAVGLSDVTPTLSAVLSKHPDCFTWTGDGQTFVKFIAGARKLGYTGKFITATGSLTPQFLKVLGPTGDGIIAVNSTVQPSSQDPMEVKFVRQMTAYLKGNGPEIQMDTNEFGQDGWSSVQLVAQALAGAKTVSASYLLKKIPTMCNVNVGNVYPHVDFCNTQGSSKALPRIFNDQWQYFVAKNGQYVSINNVWHNLISTAPH